jgi:hypothetical protein
MRSENRSKPSMAFMLVNGPKALMDLGALGGSRTTWEHAATSQNAMFMVVDGVWPLPPRGPRSL